MARALEHRGPDSDGTYLADGIGITVRRLRVIDLTTGDQPVTNEDGSVVVVLNGEIYNYRELRAALRARGHRLSTSGDTEVIAHLYEDHGVDCVHHLRGMFSFALWDDRRKQLLLARDRLGKKPLFYADLGDELVFGSEPRALLQDEAVPRTMDAEAIDHFLAFQYVPDPLSAFAALRKLPPAHWLTWRDGSVRVGRYWKLSYGARPVPGTEPELVEMLRSEILEATRLRLRSDVPVGAFLSGGVDSSCVVAAMARSTSGDVKTFTIGFDAAAFDERERARKVARFFGTDHHELTLDADATKLIPRLVWHYGEPFADQSALPTFHLSELARRSVTVALSGDGGDENFAGYPRYLLNAASDRLPAPPGAAAAAHLLQRYAPGAAAQRWVARAANVVSGSRLSPPDRYFRSVALFDDDQRHSLYTPDLASSVAGSSPRTLLRRLYESSDAETLVERLVDVDLNSYLPGDLLVKTDIASMAHSLEVRSPLLDHRLMEFVAGIPLNRKYSHVRTKRLLRKALRGWLPRGIPPRGKTPFNVPLRDWFRAGARDLAPEVLLDPTTLARGLFRADRLHALIDDHATGRADHASRIWALLQLELWLRSYVDPPLPAPVTGV